MTSRKPRLGLDAYRLLDAIRGEVVRHHLPKLAAARRDGRTPEAWWVASAASDLMDGWKVKRDPEVRELLRKRLLELVPNDDPANARHAREMGVTVAELPDSWRYSFHLTERSLRLVCPELFGMWEKSQTEAA